MQADLDGWTIVLAGAWNQAIFSPRWIAKNMLGLEGEQQVEIGIVLNADERVFRFPSKRVAVHVSPTRLMIQPVVGDEEVLRAANECATRVISTLLHTPISAVGFNYLFKTEEPPSALRAVLDTRDAAQLGECALTTSGTRVVRSLTGVGVHSDPVLNLTFNLDHETAVYTVDFNYNYSRSESSPFAASMEGVFIGLRDHARRVLRSYGATLEEGA